MPITTHPDPLDADWIALRVSSLPAWFGGRIRGDVIRLRRELAHELFDGSRPAMRAALAQVRS